MTAPRRTLLVLSLLTVLLWGCDATLAPVEVSPLHVGKVTVSEGSADAKRNAHSVRVHRPAMDAPVVLEPITPGRLDAYFDVEVLPTGPVDLDLYDADAPAGPSARLRQTRVANGWDLRFVANHDVELSVKYVFEGEILKTETLAPRDSVPIANSNEDADSVHYIRDGDEFIIVYDFTDGDPATVSSLKGASIGDCTEIHVRGPADALNLARPALSIGGSGWHTVRVDDGTDRLAPALQ